MWVPARASLDGGCRSAESLDITARLRATGPFRFAFQETDPTGSLAG